MQRKLFFLLFLFCFFSFDLIAQESKDSSLQVSSEVSSTSTSPSSEVSKPTDTKETAQEHFDKAKDHLIAFGIESIAAGASITHGPLGGAIAIYEMAQASKSLIEAAKEYNEGKRIENEAKGAEEKQDYERAPDHDSWDREY